MVFVAKRYFLYVLYDIFAVLMHKNTKQLVLLGMLLTAKNPLKENI